MKLSDDKNSIKVAGRHRKGDLNNMREYLEIPLSTESIVMNLNNAQAGRLFKAALDYAFNNVKPNFSDDLILKNAFTAFIRQCKKHSEQGSPDFITSGYIQTFEDYEEE